MSWDDDQSWEAEWWGDCTNTFGEEAKQITYAHRMGLENVPRDGHWPVYDLGGRRVIDLGGGPVSMLLKCVNRGDPCLVVDPLDAPDWVERRYDAADITLIPKPIEEIEDRVAFDEVWIYNVLQHVQDPQRCVEIARELGKRVRIFEWVNVPVSPGHPHVLTELELGTWLGMDAEELAALGPRNGRNAGASLHTEQLDGENGCVGRAFYGVADG